MIRLNKNQNKSIKIKILQILKNRFHEKILKFHERKIVKFKNKIKTIYESLKK